MKLVKLKMSSQFLTRLGYVELFKYIKFYEIIHAYSYDRTNFFSKQRIVFHPGMMNEHLEDVKKILRTDVFQTLSQSGDEIVALTQQRNDIGFYPLLVEQTFAVIPPITIDSEFIKVTLMAPAEALEQLYTILGRISNNAYEILASYDMRNELIDRSEGMFTERQREICVFAYRNGFFESPRKITAEAIAEKFNISVSAFNEHIRKVEKLVMKYFFG